MTWLPYRQVEERADRLVKHVLTWIPLLSLSIQKSIVLADKGTTSTITSVLASKWQLNMICSGCKMNNGCEKQCCPSLLVHLEVVKCNDSPLQVVYIRDISQVPTHKTGYVFPGLDADRARTSWNGIQHFNSTGQDSGKYHLLISRRFTRALQNWIKFCCAIFYYAVHAPMPIHSQPVDTGMFPFLKSENRTRMKGVAHVTKEDWKCSFSKSRTPFHKLENGGIDDIAS